MTDDVIQTGKKLVIDVWADVLCPWCYIGEHRLKGD
ncbi:MAG: DsbA family protein [Bifidobacterium crudilactis]|nr:DsbA family protein [Bifidobacterium crudilactis]